MSSTPYELHEIISEKGVFTDGDWVESKDQDQNGDVRLIQLADVGVGEFINKSNRFMTSEKARELRCTFLEPGDILVARMPDPIGRACIFPGLSMPCVTVVDVCIIRPASKYVDPKWLMYILNSKKFNNKILQYVTGTTRQRISRGNLAKLEVHLPPLAEQIRIAAILDKADAIRRKRQQAIQLADDFLRAVFLDMFDDPVTNPKGWEVKALSTLVSKLGDGLHGTPKYDDNGEYFFINGNNLNNGNIEINDSVKKVNKVEFEKHKKDLNERTMLVSINGTIGKVAYYRGEKILLGKSACYFNIIPEYVSDVYLFHLIQSNYFFYYTGTVFTGSTIKNVSLKSMREFPVPLPPKYIQEEFVAKAIKIEKMKKRTFYSLAEQQKLFESLSQKAFAGEL